MDEDKKTIILIILIFLIIIASVVTGTILVLNSNKSNSVNNNSNTTENRETNNNKSVVEKNNAETDINLNSWIGTYENGDTTIKMYRINVNDINVEIINNTLRNEYYAGNSDAEFSKMATLKAISEGKLYSKDEWFDTTDIIEIEKISNGIKIKASSTDEDSLLNFCNGKYESKDFEKLDWSGTYTNNENTIIISEVYEDDLCIMVDSKTKNSTKVIENIENYSKDIINYESVFSDEEKIKITKTSKGIKVEASSKDEENITNYISGTYTKE